MLGKIVKVTVDRPLGSCHPKHPDICYPVNYGYVKGLWLLMERNRTSISWAWMSL